MAYKSRTKVIKYNQRSITKWTDFRLERLDERYERHEDLAIWQLGQATRHELLLGRHVQEQTEENVQEMNKTGIWHDNWKVIYFTNWQLIAACKVRS